MLFVALACLALSAAVSYLIGAAFVAPRESYWRTRRGVFVLIIGGLSLVTLPPQMTMLDSALGSMAGGLDVSFFAWPSAIGKGAYLALWAFSSIATLLVGLRIWQAGSPDWAGRAGRAYDASGASRIESLLPMAKDLPDALDTLRRANLVARDVPRVAESLRSAGRRFANELPATDGTVYQLVARHVPASLAASVTGLLLEGAGRRAPRG